MKNFFKNKCFKSALRTFIQAFCAYISVSLVTADLSNGSIVKALIISAIASGISAVMQKREEKHESNTIL